MCVCVCVCVWGCVSGAGMGRLKRLEGKVDAEAYYHILHNQIGPTMKLQGGRHLSFSYKTMHLYIQLRRICSSLSKITTIC